jgi:hypothetical protein
MIQQSGRGYGASAPPEGARQSTIQNPDGTSSSELSITVQVAELNGGRPTNIPTIFNGQRVSEDEAIRRVLEAGGRDPETGRQLQGFNSIDEAVAAAGQRSNALGIAGQQPSERDIPFGGGPEGIRFAPTEEEGVWRTPPGSSGVSGAQRLAQISQIPQQQPPSQDPLTGRPSGPLSETPTGSIRPEQVAALGEIAKSQRDPLDLARGFEGGTPTPIGPVSGTDQESLRLADIERAQGFYADSAQHRPAAVTDPEKHAAGFDAIRYGATPSPKNAQRADIPRQDFDPSLYSDLSWGARGSLKNTEGPTDRPEGPKSPEDRNWVEASIVTASMFAESINPWPVVKMLTDIGPVGIIEAIGQRSLDQAPKMWEAFDRGENVKGLGYFFSMVPLLGPESADIAEDLSAGRYAEANGRLLGLLSPFALTKYRRGRVQKRNKWQTTKTDDAHLSVEDVPVKPWEFVGQWRRGRGQVGRPPERMMTIAIKPRQANSRWDLDMRESMPHLKAAERAMGRPIQNLDDLLEAIKISQDRLWQRYEAKLGPSASATIDGNRIADSMMDSIDQRMKIQNPNLVEQIRKKADTYRRDMTLKEAESFLQSTNKSLNNWYDTTGAKRAAAENHPTMGSVVAEGRIIRDLLYEKLDELTGPGGRSIKREYGALTNVRNMTERRWNVFNRQQMYSLSEKFGYVRGVGRAGASLYKGDVGGFMEGMANIGMAKYLKDIDSVPGQIRTAFEQYRPTRFKDLPTGPDAPAGYLPPGPRRMPQGPDAPDLQSDITVSEAGRSVQRGTQGRMQRVYSAENQIDTMSKEALYTEMQDGRRGLNRNAVRRRIRELDELDAAEAGRNAATEQMDDEAAAEAATQQSTVEQFSEVVDETLGEDIDAGVIKGKVNFRKINDQVEFVEKAYQAMVDDFDGTPEQMNELIRDQLGMPDNITETALRQIPPGEYATKLTWVDDWLTRLDKDYRSGPLKDYKNPNRPLDMYDSQFDNVTRDFWDKLEGMDTEKRAAFWRTGAESKPRQAGLEKAREVARDASLENTIDRIAGDIFGEENIIGPDDPRRPGLVQKAKTYLQKDLPPGASIEEFNKIFEGFLEQEALGPIHLRDAKLKAFADQLDFKTRKSLGLVGADELLHEGILREESFRPRGAQKIGMTAENLRKLFPESMDKIEAGLNTKVSKKVYGFGTLRRISFSQTDAPGIAGVAVIHPSQYTKMVKALDNKKPFRYVDEQGIDWLVKQDPLSEMVTFESQGAEGLMGHIPRNKLD